MKKRFYNWLLRLFIAPEPIAERDTESFALPCQAVDVPLLRASATRFFRYNPSLYLYIVTYSPLYDYEVDEMRQDGWDIVLSSDTAGGLFYVISSKGISVQP